MFLDPQKFPRWASPLVGGAVGCMVGLHTGRGWLEIGIGTGCGIAAGCLLLFVETPATADQEATWLGKLFAVLAIPSVIFPPVGVPICVAAFIMNRRVAGWSNEASRWGLALCVVIACIILVTVAFIR
jgi:hypothetical protein